MPGQLTSINNVPSGIKGHLPPSERIRKAYPDEIDYHAKVDALGATTIVIADIEIASDGLSVIALYFPAKGGGTGSDPAGMR
jgi:hypothetical protein